jgi:putative acetyltransferase
MADLPLSVAIRPHQQADTPHVRRLLEQAFGGTDEADLVERLNADRDLVLALVAEHDGRIVGYVAFSRLTITQDYACEMPTVSLAPLAVAANVRRRGIGGTLVQTGLTHLRDLGETLVFVLGDPAYYRRFGFEVADPAFDSAYSGPHFMQVRLRGGGPVSGAIHYPAAFAALG